MDSERLPFTCPGCSETTEEWFYIACPETAFGVVCPGCRRIYPITSFEVGECVGRDKDDD